MWSKLNELAFVIVSVIAVPSLVLAEEGWGPPPPNVPVQGEQDDTLPDEPGQEDSPDPPPPPPQILEEPEDDEPSQPPPPPPHPEQPPPEPAPPPEPVPPPPQPSEPPTSQDEPNVEISTDQVGTDNSQETSTETPEDTGEEEARGGRFRRFLSRIGVQLHGYSRMPLNLHFRPREGSGGSEEEGEGEDGSYIEVRSPLLRDNDYYASGFEYTRLAETDWTEIFLTVGGEDLDVTVGIFASLLSDWAHIEQGAQFGLAQAALHWRNIAGVPLSLKAGVFWERLGYIEPYDTYMFGRTHWMGLRLGWDFPCGANIRIGFGANKEWYERNVGMTPLVMAYGGMPIGPVTLNAYILYSFMNDIPPHQADNWERGHLLVLGLDARVDFPWFDGPLTITFAGHFAEHALYMSGVTEQLHSWSGRGLTENYFGLESNDGTGRIFSAAGDWPIQIWRGLGVRAFGMLSFIWSDQVSDDPVQNRDRVLKLKWGLEASYQILDWLRVSLQYHRVIPTMDQNIEGLDRGGLPTLAWRALSPEVRFTPYRDIHIRLQYVHYFYGDDVELRPGQALMNNQPDEDVIRIAAEATW